MLTGELYQQIKHLSREELIAFILTTNGHMKLIEQALKNGADTIEKLNKALIQQNANVDRLIAALETATTFHYLISRERSLN